MTQEDCQHILDNLVDTSKTIPAILLPLMVPLVALVALNSNPVLQGFGVALMLGLVAYAGVLIRSRATQESDHLKDLEPLRDFEEDK